MTFTIEGLGMLQNCALHYLFSAIDFITDLGRTNVILPIEDLLKQYL
jgi:hypothetical protein